MVRTARTPHCILAECHGVSSQVAAVDSAYTFHYAFQPLDFSGILDGRRIEFGETETATMIPLARGAPFRADMTKRIPGPIYISIIQCEYLESLAEELFDVGRVEFRGNTCVCRPDLEHSISRFIEEASSSAEGAALMAESLSTLIVVDSLRMAWPERSSRSLAASARRHPGVARARRAMIRHYREPLGLDELARIAHLSVSQFIAVFKKETGETPHDYLRRVRIRAAMRLLQEGYDVIDVSLSVGFGSSSGFRSAFRKLVGMGPEAYRTVVA